MIEEFLLWLELINQSALQDLVATSQNLSNLIFLCYLITIRKSYLFGAAFLLCEIVNKINIIPTSLPLPLYGATFYCAYILTWIGIAGLHIRRTTNKNTLIACVIMLLFLLFMVGDSYFNAYIETTAWLYYENIIAVIHFAIIFSLYRDRFIFGRVGFIALHFCRLLRLNVYQFYFWYTIKNINQGEKK